MARTSLSDAAKAAGPNIRPIEPDEIPTPAQPAPGAPTRPQTGLTKRVVVYADPDRHGAATAALKANDGRSYSRLVHDLVGEWLLDQRP